MKFVIQDPVFRGLSSVYNTCYSTLEPGHTLCRLSLICSSRDRDNSSTGVFTLELTRIVPDLPSGSGEVSVRVLFWRFVLAVDSDRRLRTTLREDPFRLLGKEYIDFSF